MSEVGGRVDRVTKDKGRLREYKVKRCKHGVHKEEKG